MTVATPISGAAQKYFLRDVKGMLCSKFEDRSKTGLTMLAVVAGWTDSKVNSYSAQCPMLQHCIGQTIIYVYANMVGVTFNVFWQCQYSLAHRACWRCSPINRLCDQPMNNGGKFPSFHLCRCSPFVKLLKQFRSRKTANNHLLHSAGTILLFI